MHKDIFRHSSTRRTITRFIAAVGLLVGLGIYVYLGARAEALLMSIRRTGGEGGTQLQR